MSAAPALSPDELQRLLRRAEPAALLVAPRILRRVIKQDRRPGGLGLQVPHADSYVLSRDALLRIATPDELGVPPGGELPDPVILLARPDAHSLAGRPGAETLLRTWRRLFHAEVHRAFPRLDEEGVRARVGRLGQVEFDEVRAVLDQDRMLLPPADAAGVYEEFAAVYLELRCFEPERLAQTFPGLTDRAAVDALLAEDVDAGGLLARSRPAGAPDPGAGPGPGRAEEDEAPAFEEPPPGPPPGDPTRDALLAKAEKASGRGNNVRAALLSQRAARGAGGGEAKEVRRAARSELARLVGRLRKALEFPAEEVPAWEKALGALLVPAARGWWNPEGKLLYDLQKVCVDHERETYAVDLVEWVVTAFRRPVRRLLPDQPLVLDVKHLRSALRGLRSARVDERARDELGRLLHEALGHAEERLRDRLRPRLLHALDAVGLAPGSYAERVARDKLVEELLDRVVGRGFLTFGDLRDAVARNQLKLPDLGGPVEFFTGDPLLRANRQLAYDLDGVYRRGEVYLRWLQRLSSLAFGTRVGRFLTDYLGLPFGGAFFVLMGIEAVAEELHKLAGTPEVPTLSWRSLAALGVFFLLLLHVPAFRRGVGRGLSLAWRGLRAVLYDLPAGLLRLPPVRRLLASRPAQLVYEFGVQPGLWTAAVAVVLVLARVGPAATVAAAAGTFLAVILVLHSRWGMVVEEEVTDRLARTWKLVRDDLLPGLFRAVIYFFKRLLEEVERLLYAVDEWLRFRAGESAAAFYAKLVLGFFWFWVTYVVRFVVNLLVEPQVNPIKHFPVVTVSHKLLLPLAFAPPKAFHRVPSPLAALLLQVAPVSVGKANTIAATVVWGIPGIFGFLVWELKENRRLYRANVPPDLRPEVVGSHGETVLRLLRPGLHSGTVPKLYAKLRHARGSAARKREEELHHVAEAVRHFVARDLLALLGGSRAWGPRVTVGGVVLATNFVRVELCRPDLPGDSAHVEFANRAGWLVAGFARAGWVRHLSPAQADALADALAGLYKFAGVDAVREQVEGLLPAGAEWDLTADGLEVRAAPGAEVVYDLGGSALTVRSGAGKGGAGLAGLPAGRVLFGRVPLPWEGWVRAWERDQEGAGHEPRLLPEVRLLP
jgi:hypothetical protein